MSRIQFISILLGNLLCWGAPAETIYLFQVGTDPDAVVLDAGGDVTINWDVKAGAKPILRESDEFTASVNYTAAQFAQRFANRINVEYGSNIATANANFVELDPSITSISLRTGTTRGLITMAKEDQISVTAGEISFNPDPDTGMDVLTGPGTFDITGPGGLNDVFTADAGTTGDQLAMELGGVLYSAGYDPNVSGDTVAFLPPSVGTVAFAPSGDGIEYEFGETPEPPTIWMLAGATLLWISRWRVAHP